MGEVILKDGRKMVLRKGNNVCPECDGAGQVPDRVQGRTPDGHPKITWDNPWLKEVLVRSFVCLTCDTVYFTHAYREDDHQTNPPCGHRLGVRNIQEERPFDMKRIKELKSKGKIPKTKWTRGKPS